MLLVRAHFPIRALRLWPCSLGLAKPSAGNGETLTCMRSARIVLSVSILVLAFGWSGSDPREWLRGHGRWGDRDRQLQRFASIADVRCVPGK